MKKTFVIVVVLFVGFIGFLAGGLSGGFLTALLAAGTMGALLILDAAIVHVPQFYVAPIFRREARRFSRFLSAGHHVINPLLETVGDMINVGTQTERGTCENALTLGGLPISLQWSILYLVDPYKINAQLPGLDAKMAGTLPQFSGKIVANHANNVLKHIVSKHTIDYFIEEVPQERLEKEFKAAVQERVRNLGFSIYRTMILDMRIPPNILASLEAAQKQLIVAEAEAKALRRLHAAIDDFDGEDIDHLERLERLKLLGNEGGSMAYLMSSWLDENTRQMNRERLRPSRPPDEESAGSRQTGD